MSGHAIHEHIVRRSPLPLRIFVTRQDPQLLLRQASCNGPACDALACNMPQHDVPVCDTCTQHPAWPHTCGQIIRPERCKNARQVAGEQVCPVVFGRAKQIPCPCNTHTRIPPNQSLPSHQAHMPILHPKPHAPAPYRCLPILLSNLSSSCRQRSQSAEARARG